MEESVSLPQYGDVPIALGVFTDIQYADKPDKEIKSKGSKRTRYFSAVLAKTGNAVAHFNANNVAHVVHLGDIIDGNETRDRTEADLRAVLQALAPLRAPLSHVLGNHCLDLDRAEITVALALPAPPRAAQQVVDLSPRWRLIVLDTMALSLRGATEQDRADARRRLETHSDDLNATVYNGGLGDAQIAWLRAELERARDAAVSVIIAAHHPFALAVAPAHLVAWDNQHLIDLLAGFPATVRAVFTGHYHNGGYGVVDGIHHVGFESILDSQSTLGSHGIAYLFDDRIEIGGVGNMSSRVLKFSVERSWRF